jgi:hypothetical protein
MVSHANAQLPYTGLWALNAYLMTKHSKSHQNTAPGKALRPLGIPPKPCRKYRINDADGLLLQSGDTK